MILPPLARAPNAAKGGIQKVPDPHFYSHKNNDQRVLRLVAEVRKAGQGLVLYSSGD